MIPREFIQQVNDSVDLPALVAQYVPELVKKSGDTYTACCPFHEEKTPSFTVTAVKGFYHCFGCGAHGNAVNFLMEHNKVSFIDALKEAAALVGMEVPKSDRQPKSQKEREVASRFVKASSVLNEAARIYSKQLHDDKDAMDYLLIERGLTLETIERFGIGYSTNQWHTLTGDSAFTKTDLENAGLSASSVKNGKTYEYDRFRDRIMVPIRHKDFVIGFGGRAVHGQEPKYLNSPETESFKKGRVLFGLPQAIDSIRQNRRVFVVEGYMDAISLSQYGITNVVATLGTAVTEDQIKRLFGLCEHITFCMDGDKPGLDAAWRIAESVLAFMTGQHTVDFMFLPDDMDPDDFVKAKGKYAFTHEAGHARTLTEYILESLKQNTDMSNAESMARYFTLANGFAMKMPEGALRLSFRKQIAAGADVSLDTMLSSTKAVEVNEKNGGISNTVAIEPVPSGAGQYLEHVSVDGANISVASKIIGLAAIASQEFAAGLNTEYLSRYLGYADKEMLLPLLVYLKANPQASVESLVSSLSFNHHAKMIKSLAIAAKTTMGVDFVLDAKIVLDSFSRMELIWKAVQVAKEVKPIAA